jgi:hypothetical protein
MYHDVNYWWTILKCSFCHQIYYRLKFVEHLARCPIKTHGRNSVILNFMKSIPLNELKFFKYCFNFEAEYEFPIWGQFNKLCALDIFILKNKAGIIQF